MKTIMMVAMSSIASLCLNAQDSEYGTTKEWNDFYARPKQKLINKSEKPTKSDVNFVVYLSTNKSLGMDIVFGKKFMFGGGLSMYMGSNSVGKEYTNFHWTTFREDIYEHITTKDVGLYLIAGYRPLKNLLVLSNIGIGTWSTFHNGFDNYKILGNNGYYFTKENNKTESLIGLSLQYELVDMNIHIGFDTFNGAKIGLGFIL